MHSMTHEGLMHSMTHEGLMHSMTDEGLMNSMTDEGLTDPYRSLLGYLILSRLDHQVAPPVGIEVMITPYMCETKTPRTSCIFVATTSHTGCARAFISDFLLLYCQDVPRLSSLA
jgi:hypothetical protein